MSSPRTPRGSRAKRSRDVDEASNEPQSPAPQTREQNSSPVSPEKDLNSALDCKLLLLVSFGEL